jgi:alpha-acetolactate decarboxylase
VSRNKFFISLFLCFLFPHMSFVQAAEPFNLRNYGNFKKMVHMKRVGGVVKLKTALSAAHTYAMGAIKGGKGEITVIDSEVWLAYGRDRFDRIVRAIPEEEQAAMLVSVEVKNWQEIIVPKKMSESQLHPFIVEQAEESGLNTKKPFPFLIEGAFQDLKWHVINGLNPEFRENLKNHGGQPPFLQLKEYRKQASGTVIGIYSADLQGVYTHPGESWHLHIVFRDKKRAGHVEKITVLQDTILKLPIP